MKSAGKWKSFTWSIALTGLILALSGNAYGDFDDFEFPVKKVGDLGRFLDGWRAAGPAARQNFLQSLDRPDSDSAGAGQYDLLSLVESCPETDFEEVSAAARLDLLKMDEAVASMAYACAQEAIRRGARGDAREFLLIARDRKTSLSLAAFRDGAWESELIGVTTERAYITLRMFALHSELVASLARLTESHMPRNGSAVLVALLITFLVVRVAQFPLLMRSRGDKIILLAYFAVELCVLVPATFNASDWDFWFGDWRRAVAPWLLRISQLIATVLYLFVLSRLVGLHTDGSSSEDASLGLVLLVVAGLLALVAVPIIINLRGAPSSAPFATTFFSTGALAMFGTELLGSRFKTRPEAVRTNDPVGKLPDPQMIVPVFKEVQKGRLAVREVFRISGGAEVAAGCVVLDGVITRDNEIQLFRKGIVVHTGRLGSLRRLKRDVREVRAGFECGLTLRNFSDVRPGDVIHAFMKEAVHG